MAPPNGYVDFYELELQMNYNNAIFPYIQEFSPAGLQPPQERQAGWNERYIINQPVSGSPPYSACYSLAQARSALLGLNFYIKKAIIHQATLFKSSFPLPNSAKMPLFDNLATRGTATQTCSSPEETILLRQESSLFRRWEYQIRGIKDYMSGDSMSYFAAPSYFGNGAPPTGVFDTAAASSAPPTTPAGTAATFSVTLTAGVPSAPVGPANGNYPGVAAGEYYTYLLPQNGVGTPALALVTINGGAQAASVDMSSFSTGSGWTGTTAVVPISNDPYGLPNWQTPAYYWTNFMSCLILFTASGTMRRIPNSQFTDPKPTFPSGQAPVLLSPLRSCTRSMFQRVGNRQTGQIRLTKPARVRRGI